jgi:hypothetical protein
MKKSHSESSQPVSSGPTKDRIVIGSYRYARTASWPIRWLLPRRPKSSAVVRIKVRQLSQLFNSLDPSPFWDRDLDRQAADFIEEEFRDRLSADTWHLVVQVQEGSTSAEHLQTALKSHYLRQANSARLALREHLWVGQLALGGGVAVFLMSMVMRALLRNSWLGISPWFEEGLVILAWLALWRPAEALLYGWVPYNRRRRRYERLARIHVAVRLGASNATDVGHTKSVAMPPVIKESLSHSARTEASARQGRL